MPNHADNSDGRLRVMKVLLTTTAGIGHVHPMVPLARALAQRGHDVLWAAPPEAQQRITTAGISATSIGTVGLTNPASAKLQFPEMNNLAPEDVPAVMFSKLFGAIAAPVLLADLVPIAVSWNPDLVVADAAEFAGHIVAAELGIPSVTKSFGPLLPESRVALAGKEVTPLWESRGLEPRPYGGSYDNLYLDIYPPALQSTDASHVRYRQLMRPVAYDGVDETTPIPFPEGSSEQPLIYITLGTVFNDPTPLRMAIEACASLDTRILVSVGPGFDPAALATFGSHVRVEHFVAQTRVFPHCDVVISHGGSGTFLSALDHDLPQLCLPQGADQFLNAAAVTSAGAGISLAPNGASVESIRAAVSQLLEEKSFRLAAHTIRESLEAMPSPNDVGAVLEALI